MAGLPTYRAPVDYDAQQSAFASFLTSYKSSASADSAEDVNGDGGGTSDEYDFMDDVVDGEGHSQSRRQRDPKRKYVDRLQEIADRKREHIYIDLDDLDEVCAVS